VTVKLAVVECIRAPLAPVMVNVSVPVPVLPAVETVRVDAGYGGPSEAGLSVQVLCEGQPETLSPTLLLKPFRAVTVTV